MFPAHAGMNRPPRPDRRNQSHVPRTRGDEPASDSFLPNKSIMFPAHAGMNRVTLNDRNLG